LLSGGCFAGEVATARAISAADTIMVFAQIPLFAGIYALLWLLVFVFWTHVDTNFVSVHIIKT
jgi:hypothetical protein